MPDLVPVKLSAEEIRRILLDEAKKYTPIRPWQPWEDEILREFQGIVPRHALAKNLGRTLSMVSHRIEKLGLTQRDRSESSPYPRKQKSK